MRDYVKSRFDAWIGADGCDLDYKGSDPQWMEEERKWAIEKQFQADQGQESGESPLKKSIPSALLSNQEENPDVLVSHHETKEK